MTEWTPGWTPGHQSYSSQAAPGRAGVTNHAPYARSQTAAAALARRWHLDARVIKSVLDRALLLLLLLLPPLLLLLLPPLLLLLLPPLLLLLLLDVLPPPDPGEDLTPFENCRRTNILICNMSNSEIVRQ